MLDSIRTYVRALGRSNVLFPRKLKLTREGKYFLFITLGVGFGAINSGQNLLYLVLGMLLAFITASGILSEVTLRKIEVEHEFPPTIFARTPALLQIKVTNGKRLFASYGLQIEDIWPEGVISSPSYLVKVPPKQRQTLFINVSFPRRGEYIREGYKIGTGFPFAFFKKTRNIYQSHPLLVYPQIIPVNRLMLRSRGHSGSHRTYRVGKGEEFFELRDWRTGDETNRIHWKISAKLNRLVIREFEEEQKRKIVLGLSNYVEANNGEMREAVEAAITMAASLADAYHRAGWMVGLMTLDGSFPPQTGERHIHQMFAHLARLPVYDRTTLPASLPLKPWGNKPNIVEIRAEDFLITTAPGLEHLRDERQTA